MEGGEITSNVEIEWLALKEVAGKVALKAIGMKGRQWKREGSMCGVMNLMKL